MSRRLSTIGITEDQLHALQQLSGLKQPGSYGRELLQKAIYAEVEARKNSGHPLVAPPPVVEPTPEPEPWREEFDARWFEVECDVDWDPALKKARTWFISQQRGQTPQEQEETALRFVERAVGRGSMNNPRGWLIKQYQKWLDEQGPAD